MERQTKPLQFRGPSLSEMIDATAKREPQTRSEYVRRSIIDPLKAGGIDPLAAVIARWRFTIVKCNMQGQPGTHVQGIDAGSRRAGTFVSCFSGVSPLTAECPGRLPPSHFPTSMPSTEQTETALSYRSVSTWLHLTTCLSMKSASAFAANDPQRKELLSRSKHDCGDSTASTPQILIFAP